MPIRELEPVLLSTFLAVLEAGRISAAARLLHLSQPAVTAQVRRLEEALGAALFVRSAQGVAPTDAGVRLAAYAREVRRTLEAAASAIASGEEPAGELVVGASTTIAAHILPSLLARFRAAHRAVPFRVRVGNTEQIVGDVRTGKLPLGLVEGHARAPGVRLTPFMDDEIVAVVGRDAPFTLQRASDLGAIPIRWREPGSGTRAIVERALAKGGVRRRAIRALDVELGSTEAIVGGAVAGLGVAFVSRVSVRAHLDAGLVRVVPGLDLVLRRTFRWALPSGALSGMAARFHDFVGRGG
ncbi:MAG TPA: LysR substrate-binding domain-containing protein [Polyangiaceae bacterium]|nr:LysR substrate-binding domain-containing protein [Polyangiaceae bacterium]